MTKQLFNIQNFSFSYSSPNDGAWQLDIPNFTIGTQELCLVSGDNMSGKTTFLNLIGGLLPLSSCVGTMHVYDHIIEHREELLPHSILLSTDDKMFPELSVWENVYIALPHFPLSQKNNLIKNLNDFLQESDIFSSDILNIALGNLSSGGRALVKLGRAYASNQPLVIIDEISSFLDAKRASYFLDKVIALKETGRSVIVVSHNERDRKHLLSHDETRAYHISRKLDKSTLMKLDV
ncbi:ATP-binding cassette domain-containing protein [Kordiimonas marina]|uniref:ATP-binding cassette domain-containing protein n=1 Tax=Kordiimonas marina TaxID=2872312 RepID=UPI001FF29322|nr:ATP-binding cassette domain-containing protein [Kordiimonas marina]MCJ9430747.1 ATP-binding cassette domain-containing protein [Kordiimonas marina]